MKKFITLERPTYQPMYRIQDTSEKLFIRAFSTQSPWILRDAPSDTDTAWESFDASSLPTYFTRGLNALHRNIGQLQDLLQPYSEQDEKKLLFMVESLMQARRLMEKVRVSVE